MSQKSTAKQKLKLEYDAVYSVAQSFSTELDRQLTMLFEKKKIPLGFPIQRRVKTWASISEKLRRHKVRLKTITQLQDLIGLRVVVLFKRDLKLAEELIEKSFRVENKYDTLSRLKEDQFGYSSIHFVVRFPRSWLDVPSVSGLGELKAELQLRTSAQHIWAEVSHVLQYKMEKDVPRSLLRSVYRVSALLETVDLEFERVLEERENYRSGIDISTTKEALNVDTLEKYLDSILPRKNKDRDEDYAELLTELDELGISTIKKLNTLLVKALPKVMEDEAASLQEVKREIEVEGDTIRATVDRVNAGVFYTHVGLTRVALHQTFGNKYEKLRRLLQQ